MCDLRYTPSVTKRLVDVDDELLTRAAQVLQTATMKETVNTALAEVVRAERRRQHADRLARMEGLDLNKRDVMARAWRR